MKKLAYLFMTGLLFVPFLAFAHPGGLDGNSCHSCRTSCEEKYSIPINDYHCHLNGDRSVYSYPNAQVTEPEPAPESEPISEPTPEPVNEPVPVPEPTPEPEPTITTTSEPEVLPVVEGPAENVDSAEDVADLDEEQDSEEAQVTQEESATAETNGETSDEEVPEAGAGATAVALAILGGLGYGGYRIVKGGVNKVKKITKK